MDIEIDRQTASVASRLTVGWCALAHLQEQLMQVFDRAPAGEAPDIEVDFWWTFGEPVVKSSTFGVRKWSEWKENAADCGVRRALFLTDLPMRSSLVDKFGVGSGVIVDRSERGTFVGVGYADSRSDSEDVRRLRTASHFLDA